MQNGFYTICFDTLCQGPQPVMENDKPILFGTEAEAENEIASDPEFYDGCFPCLLSAIGRKAIFYGQE